MKASKQFEEITSYQSSNFLEWFGDMEMGSVLNVPNLYSKKLPRSMNDREILAEMKPTEVTLEEIFSQLMLEKDHKIWGIFYCKDIAGVLRGVFVRWSGEGWSVRAFSVGRAGRWLDGSQVFSRNSFETQASDPVALGLL